MGKGRVVTPVTRRVVIWAWCQVTGSGRRFLSGALHRCPGVVKNERVFTSESTGVRVRKLVEPTRIRLGSWNVGSLTGKLRELVNTATRRRVNILCVQETK